MADVFVFNFWSARPSDILFAFGQRLAHGMKTFDKFAVFAEHIENRGADSRHDSHIHNNIRTVGNFHTDFGNRGADGTMEKGITYRVLPFMHPS